MVKTRLALSAGLAAILASAAAAQDVPWPVRLRHDLNRLVQIEWRLRQASGDRCPVQANDIGVVFDDRAAYPEADRDALSQAIGLGADPVFAGVANGGPAAQAGIVIGDVVASLNGRSAREIVAARPSGEPAPDALLRMIATEPAGHPVTFELIRNGVSRQVTVQPVLHCAVRAVLETDRAIDAHSDVRNVAVSTGMVTFAQSDDELALAVAHEFGHVIHQHRRTSSISKRRTMEDIADVAGAQLMVAAGYDVERGLNLFRKLARRDVLAFLRAPTHRKYGARIKLIRAAIGLPACNDC